MRETPGCKRRTRMFRYPCAVSIAIVAVAPSNAVTQQPASAGSVRPNLRVLQALPESQLFPLMNLVADSLGVRCDYCHVQTAPDLTKTPSNVGGWVWGRDDKPAKEVAREMMRMVIDLNAGRFRGESRVTCYTCHRGSPQPARTPPLPPTLTGSARTAAPPLLPSADRVWSNYVNGVGRAEALARAAGTVISGWDDRPEGRYGKLEIIVGGPDRYRATVSTANGATSQGLDRDIAWVAADGRVQRFSAPADVARMRRIAMRYRPVKERPSNLQVVGIERFADRDVYVAIGRIDDITTQTLYFDVVTGLLRRDVITTETLLLPLVEQVEYDDYRDVNGVQLPFSVRTSDGAPYATVTRTFLDIRRDVAIDDAVFRPPSAP
jgi:Photosynthetic reaction centre cytochrome C subunit